LELFIVVSLELFMVIGVPVAQGELFGAAEQFPDGLAYEPKFIEPAEEKRLLDAIDRLPLREAPYKQYTAKRRVLGFGSQYDFESSELALAPVLPEFLAPLRERVARWLGVAALDFVHALVTEYRPGTALGWHRDAPAYGIVAGVSLAGECRMRFRRYPPRKNTDGRKSADGFTLDLEPRSAYTLQRDARWRWQHSIPATKVLRYSVTFRTLAKG
jgi:alkylated DNA repair dioxygenase AlkB